MTTSNDAPLPISDVQVKFNSLKQAIRGDKKDINRCRRNFIESYIKYVDALQVREKPAVEPTRKMILEDYGKLKVIRDYLCNWVLLEGEITDTDSEKLSESIIEVLKKLRELKFPHPKVNRSEAHAVFVYETFLYIVAAFLKTGAFSVLHDIYFSDMPWGPGFESLNCHQGETKILQSVLAPEDQKLYSPVVKTVKVEVYSVAADLINRQGGCQDIFFRHIMQADLLTLLMSYIISKANWYPHTLYYLSSPKRELPFFAEAVEPKNFNKLSKITGIESADELRVKVKKGSEKYTCQFNITFLPLMKINNFCTSKKSTP